MSIFIPTTTQSGGGYRYVLECDYIDEVNGGSYSTTASYGGILFVSKENRTSYLQSITVDGIYKNGAQHVLPTMSAFNDSYMAYAIPFGKSITITFNSAYGCNIMVYRYHRYPEA